MLGHSSIVLTADTYTSVLPEVARNAAEDIASLIIAAGCLVPGTKERRRPSWRKLRRRAHILITAGLSHAHPARQIAAPHRQPSARPAVRRTQEILPSGAGTHLAKRAAKRAAMSSSGGHTMARTGKQTWSKYGRETGLRLG
jgi:hypothetical protein